MTVTEKGSEQPTRSPQAQSGTRPDPVTRAVRPFVLYFLGRPARSWVDALNRGRVIITR